MKEVLSRIDGYYLKGIDLIRFTADLTAALKETLIYRYSKDKNLLNLLNAEQAAQLYEGSSGRRILAEIDVLMSAQNAYRTASSVKNYLEIACLKMMESCMTMPGLPKDPAALHMGVDENGDSYGIF